MTRVVRLLALLLGLALPSLAQAQTECVLHPLYIGCLPAPVSVSRADVLPLGTIGGNTTKGAAVSQILGAISPADIATALGGGTLSASLSAATVNLGIEIGPSAITNYTPYIDFHTDTSGSDFNVRVEANQWTGATGWAGPELRVLGSTRVNLDGVLKVGRNTAGQGDNGAVASFIANSSRTGHGGEAGVLGYTPGAGAFPYGDIDSVTHYIENTGRLPLFTVASGVSFSVVGSVSRVLFATPLTAPQIAQLFVGMQILTNHTTPWTGWLSSWDPAGAWVQVTDGFGHLGTAYTAGQNPTGSPVSGGGAVQVAFAPLTKVWLQNSNCFLGGTPTTFMPRKCAGYELGMFNNTGLDHSWNGLSTNDPNGYSWGYDAVNLGTNRAGSAHIARGAWDAGFHNATSGQFGFLVDTLGVNGFGFATYQTTGAPFIYNPGGVQAAQAFLVTSDGAIEMGRQNTAGSPFIDFHSSGSARDYDARIIVSGGSTSVDGQATLSLTAATVTVSNGLTVIGTDDLSTAWTVTTPTVTAGTGTLTAASAHVAAKKIGRMVHVEATVTITTNGTGGLVIIVPLPYAKNGFAGQLAGSETALTGAAVYGRIAAGASTMIIQKSDNSYVGANGAVITVSGVYEAAS